MRDHQLGIWCFVWLSIYMSCTAVHFLCARNRLQCSMPEADWKWIKLYINCTLEGSWKKKHENKVLRWYEKHKKDKPITESWWSGGERGVQSVPYLNLFHLRIYHQVCGTDVGHTSCLSSPPSFCICTCIISSWSHCTCITYRESLKDKLWFLSLLICKKGVLQDNML